MRERLGRIAALGTALLLAAPASASMMLPMTVDELSEGADLVVRGRVASAESKPSVDGLRISTIVRLDVDEAWKGSPGASLEIRVPGGSFEGITQVVTGMPRFTVGEETVVFLRYADRARGAGITQVVGMAQGKLQVRGEADGPPVAVQELTGLDLVDPSSQEEVRSPLAVPVPLPDLEARVRATVR